MAKGKDLETKLGDAIRGVIQKHSPKPLTVYNALQALSASILWESQSEEQRTKVIIPNPKEG